MLQGNTNHGLVTTVRNIYRHEGPQGLGFGLGLGQDGFGIEE